MSKYSKAIAIAIAGIVELAADLGIDLTDDQLKTLRGIGTVVGAVLVFLVPNKSA